MMDFGLSPEFTGILGIVLLLALILLRIPVAYAMLLVGFLGYWFISGLTPSLNIMGTTLFKVFNNNSYSSVPLFILMGYFAYYSGIVSNLFETAKNWFGHIPGGLVQSTIIGGAGFGAISGSGPASTATLSKITIPEMVQSGVDKRLAYGTVASVGPLAALIPPSVLIIMFAIVTEQSIGKLLIGGVIPGIVVAVIYMILVYLLVKMNPSIAMPISKAGMKERMISLKNLWGFVILAGLIIFGIYTGIFTPTEAGGVSAFIVFIMMVMKHGFKWEMIKDSLVETITTTSTIFLIVGSSYTFGYFMTVTKIPTAVSDFLVSLPVSSLVILVGIILMYLILGMFMEMVSAMFLTLPIIFPAVVEMGFDPIWFGIMLVFLAEISLVTPPFGLSLFIIKGTVPDSDMSDIMKGSYPFILADMVIIVILVAFPQIVTFLPSLMN